MTNETWRKHEFYQVDPFFEQIQPALLNSVDIKRYIDKGCLIENSDFDPDLLKTASYEMRLLGQLYDWNTTPDGKLQRRCRQVCDGVEIDLPRNSISYLWMKQKLLLPEYIAARFNLHIRHVHKGILLGTGPLVDPGFFGSLLIPLHNLTDNDYVLKGGDGIIWVEFTKLSENEYWSENGSNRPIYLKTFPILKDLDNPDRYIEKSGITEVGGIQSAFRGALDRAQKSAEDARKEVNSVKRIGIVAIVIGFFAIAGSIAGLWYSGHNLITRTTSITQESHNRIFETYINAQDERIRELEKKVDELKWQDKVTEESSSSKQE